MKAIRLTAGELQLRDVEIPRRADEALVRVSLAGICHTDLEIVRGYAGFGGTLGHEFVGVAVASPDPAQLGRRVVGEINAGCGQCVECRAGDARHCPQRTVLGIRGRDGAFAEFLSLPPQNLHVVPDAVSDRQAVFAEPLAAAGEILAQVTINPTQRVAVLGDGKLGQLIARVLATTGCDLLLVGKHAAKLELAAAAGVKTTALHEIRVRSTAFRRKDFHLESLPPEGGTTNELARFDVVVEASGTAAGLQLALDLVRPRGTVVLKSTFNGVVALDTARIVVNEISVVGSRCGRFDRALALLASGQINVEPLIAAEFALTDGVAAMEHAQQPGTLKILIRG